MPFLFGGGARVERVVKNQLRELLEHRRLEEIATLATRKKRTLGSLVSLTFDPDPLIVWRAVEATGMAADRIAADDPEYVKTQLRRLHWLLNEESGGVCWHSPELMAEIIRYRPETFRDYASIVFSLLGTMEEEDLPRFRAGILWAIGRLRDVAAREVESLIPAITGCLDDSDSHVRGMAVWCLAQLGRTADLTAKTSLLSDEGEVLLYRDGGLMRVSVGDLVRQALAE